jgi:hypothetical protein
MRINQKRECDPKERQEIAICALALHRKNFDWFFRIVFQLHSLTFEDNSTLREIGKHSFTDSRLASISVPRTLKTLGKSCFRECKSIEIVVFPAVLPLSHLPARIFQDCPRLAQIRIPATVKSLGKDCFSRCESIRHVPFEPDSQLEELCTGAFAFSPFESIELPKSLEFIRDCVFSWCRELRTVTFENKSRLASIGESAFGFCDHLASISSPPTANKISQLSFDCCPVLETVIFESPRSFASVFAGGGSDLQLIPFLRGKGISHPKFRIVVLESVNTIEIPGAICDFSAEARVLTITSS